MQKIINHCLGRDEEEKTVSDYEDEDLSEDELDDIMGMLWLISQISFWNPLLLNE